MNLIFLFNNPFKKENIKVGEFNIKKAKGETTNEKYKIETKSVLQVILVIFLFFFEIIYLIYAINIDPYKYPTIVLLLYFIISTVLINKNQQRQPDLSIEENITKYRKELYKPKTFISALTNFIYCCYFGYMFYVLVF
jgi:hypothetical protein